MALTGLEKQSNCLEAVDAPELLCGVGIGRLMCWKLGLGKHGHVGRNFAYNRCEGPPALVFGDAVVPQESPRYTNMGEHIAGQDL